jgi:1-acyl-sn-glycerol-3-phosphate acyltransferase
LNSLGPAALTVAAIRSFTAYICVSLYVLVVGPPGILLALLLRSPRILFALAHAGTQMGLSIAGIRLRVTGLDQVPRDRAVVYCPNHESNLDAPVVFRALYGAHPHLRALYKAEMRKLPVLGRAMEIAGFIPVERQNRDEAIAAVEAAVAAVGAGRAFLIFPEGTRSRTGDLLPFKKGGFVLAIKGGAPIVPVAMQGLRESMARGSSIIRPSTVHITVGRPIETTGFTFDDRDKLIEIVRAEIVALLARGTAADASS